MVVPRAGEPVEAEELMALVRQKKGAIHEPKQVDFADSLPQTALGKIDKKVLRKQYWGDETRMIN